MPPDLDHFPRAGGAARTVLERLAVAALHRYPLHRGAPRIANSSLLRWLSGPGDGVGVARLRNGVPIVVDRRDFLGACVHYFGDYDPRITWICHRVLRPGDVVVDIGANCGVVTFTAAPLVGPSGEVHAFEPQPAAARLLRSTIERNGLSQVRVHELALSDEDGLSTMWVPDENRGAASLERHGDDGGTSIQVSTRRSGPYLAETFRRRPIRMMKMDVEGHEATIVRDARDFLASNGPEVIVFEWNSTGVGVGDAEIGRTLDDLGYDLHVVVPTLAQVRLRRVDDAGRRALVARDYVAIHPGPARPGIERALGVTPG